MTIRDRDLSRLRGARANRHHSLQRDHRTRTTIDKTDFIKRGWTSTSSIIATRIPGEIDVSPVLKKDLQTGHRTGHSVVRLLQRLKTLEHIQTAPGQRLVHERRLHVPVK